MNDTICTQNELNKAAVRINMEMDLPFQLHARFVSPSTPDSAYQLKDGDLGMDIPDYLMGMPYNVFRGLVAHALTGDAQYLEALDDYTSTPSFLVHGQLLLRDRLDIHPPRQERDLKACFYRVCRANRLQIPEPLLGWSRRLESDYLESTTLRAIVFNSRLAHKSREELDAIMLGILQSWEGYI